VNLRTRPEYIEALRALKPNIYKFGQLITDVTVHPATRRVVESHARAFDAAAAPVLEDLFTTVSSLSGERILRFNSLMTCAGDLIYNARLKRQMYRLTGTCTGALCVGWNAFNVMWAVTAEMDDQTGTGYHERLKQWLLTTEKKGLLVAGALTDAKGNRTLNPSKQPDPDSSVRVVDQNEEGIVVRGAKVMIAGVAAAQEVFVLPGSAYREEDRDWALSFVIPRDNPGLTVIEARRPGDGREYEDEESFDTLKTGITQAYLLFEDLFVPWERVFMCREYAYTKKVIEYFTANYRACIGACVAGQGDVMAGAAIILARANGLGTRTFSDKLVQMAVNNETTFGLGVGAISVGERHPSGVWFADPLLAHTNKVQVATLPYETKRLCQEIGGGIAETGCLPSYRDIKNTVYGPLLEKYLTAGQGTGETRARAARLIEWLTLGAGVPGCMHGGGSPDGAKLVVSARTHWEENVAYAAKLAGIEEDLIDPKK